MAKGAELLRLSETHLDTKAHGGLVSHNPSIELIATAAGPKSLQVLRTNGQVVVNSSQRGEKESVQALKWKPDGQFLAVGWEDGYVRLMGLESSKAVHQISICRPATSNITCIGWARNRAGRRWASATGRSTASNWQAFAVEEDKVSVDLPRDLALLEVETALPKISPLPASGGSDDDMFVFTSRASLESLFRPLSAEDSDKVDVMIVGTGDGRVQLSIYDSFVIGDFGYVLPKDMPAESGLELTLHASHPDVSTHCLIFKPSSQDKAKVLYVVPMDLTFICSTPENLSLLASKITTLQKLLRYIKQVQMSMVHEWRSTRDLPGKYLQIVDEDLSTVDTWGPTGIEQALYHSVVTGHTFPYVHDWLVDVVAERGHKRWDKAVVSGLESLRSLVHENFLPALERIAIILSRLLGIARFHESRDEMGFGAAQISKIMDVVSCLMLVGNKILLLAMEELDLFQSFSTWLRHEVDRLASSSLSEELTEKEATMEHGKVLAYILQYMMASPLQSFLADEVKEDWARDERLADSGPSLLELLNKQLKRHDSRQAPSGVIAQVAFLCDYLSSKAKTVFQGMAAAEKRSVRFGQPSKIELARGVRKVDVRMCATHGQRELRAVTFTALTQDELESNVYIYRTEVDITNGISGKPVTRVSSLKLGDGRVLDLKFIYQDSLLVLLSTPAGLQVVAIPHQSDLIKYHEEIRVEVLTAEQIDIHFRAYALVCPPHFNPVQMEVKEASSARGKMQARLCLLGEDLQTYLVFAFDDDGSGRHGGSSGR